MPPPPPPSRSALIKPPVVVGILKKCSGRGEILQVKNLPEKYTKIRELHFSAAHLEDFSPSATEVYLPRVFRYLSIFSNIYCVDNL